MNTVKDGLNNLKRNKMKNIHVLPTDNYSPLVHSTNKYGGYFKSEHYSPMKEMGDSYQNIYITSDEEIRDVRPHKGKWHLEGGNILNKFPNYLTDLSECKLVIMTTDQELIKDGVQAIDDEFLEWFVKNPSCENVKVELIEEIPSGFTFGMFGNDEPPTELVYKIIIPKEESKQETLGEGYGGKETLEEVAHEMLVDYGIKSIGQSIGVLTVKKLMVNMAKWQAERRYSEEEVFNLCREFAIFVQRNGPSYTKQQEWFEQFKKK
jgi:hypothetical protein